MQINLKDVLHLMEPSKSSISVSAADYFMITTSTVCENYAFVVLEAVAVLLAVLGTRCGGTLKRSDCKRSLIAILPLCKESKHHVFWYPSR